MLLFACHLVRSVMVEQPDTIPQEPTSCWAHIAMASVSPCRRTEGLVFTVHRGQVLFVTHALVPFSQGCKSIGI